MYAQLLLFTTPPKRTYYEMMDFITHFFSSKQSISWSQAATIYYVYEIMMACVAGCCSHCHSRCQRQGLIFYLSEVASFLGRPPAHSYFCIIAMKHSIIIHLAAIFNYFIKRDEVRLHFELLTPAQALTGLQWGKRKCKAKQFPNQQSQETRSRQTVHRCEENNWHEEWGLHHPRPSRMATPHGR